MELLETYLGGLVVRRRWSIILITLLIVAAAGSGARLLRFENDARVYFSKENPQLQALEKLENTYTKRDNVLFVLAPQGGNVFTRETLSAVEELTEASWRIPYSSRVDSITNFQNTRAEGDDLIVEDLVQDASDLSDEELEPIEEIALSEPLLVNRLLSPSGHVTGVNVDIIKPGKSLQETAEVAAFAREMADKFSRKHPDITLYLTGGIMMDNAFGEASADDMATLVPLMYLVLLVIMGLHLRSAVGTFAAFVVIMFSTTTALGLAGWMGITLEATSVNAPTIILTLSVADSIHILITMFQEMRRGMSRHDSIRESLRVNLQPVFLTSTTTAIGFLSMNFSDAPPFRDLGNIVAMGITAALIYSIFSLPAFMAVLPLRVKARPEKRRIIFDRIGEYVVLYRARLFWGMSALIVFLGLGTLRIELNDNFIDYFDDRYYFRRAADFAEANLTGFDIIEYSIDAGGPGEINDPDYLTKLEEFANWYRAQPKVTHVSTITDIMKRLNKVMHGDDESYYRIPESRELAAQYLLLYEMSLPFGLDLNNQINVAKSSTRMTVAMKDMTAKELRDMDEKARKWLKEHAPKHMYSYGSGLSIMFAHISGRNIRSMLSGTFYALLLISGILIFAFRSLKMGFVSLIPNIGPALMAFGIWGIIVGTVGLVVSVLAALTLGIVVDDTIHFVSIYLRARREHGMSPSDAVRYSFHTVGRALWTTTVVLVAGFLVLSFSGFEINSDMGLMTALTITLALALDFLFLPVLLLKMEERQ